MVLGSPAFFPEPKRLAELALRHRLPASFQRPRGDLSIETAFTRVPIVQKDVIAGANRRAKPAITATQMLYSMVDSPTCPGQKPDRGTGRPEEVS